jgi:hypothetical protein
LLVLMVAAAIAVGLGLVFLRSKGHSQPPPSTPPALAERTRDAVSREADPPAETRRPSQVPEPAPDARREAEPGENEAARSAAAASASDGRGERASTSSGAAGVIVVTVTTVPPDARFFYKGKAVGRSPFRVELKPGERRSFEIGRPGYHARKVIVDGKKSELLVAMRPEAQAAK